MIRENYGHIGSREYCQHNNTQEYTRGSKRAGQVLIVPDDAGHGELHPTAVVIVNNFVLPHLTYTLMRTGPRRKNSPRVGVMKTTSYFNVDGKYSMGQNANAESVVRPMTYDLL